MRKLLNDLLSLYELTTNRHNECWITINNYNWYKVDFFIAEQLIISDILIKDSGNFETGESHYILDYYYPLSKIDRIDFLSNKIEKSFINNNLKKQIIYELSIIRHKEVRIKKLKKIKLTNED